MTDRMKNIATLRLELRTIRASDIPLLQLLWTDEQVRKYLGGTLSRTKAEQRIREYVGKGCSRQALR